MSLRWMLLLAALMAIAPGAAADAAVLIEARKQGEPVRMVIDEGRQRALIATPRGRSVVDLGRGEIYLLGASGPRKMPIQTRDAATAGYRVTPWGPGPTIAGHATVYHVITHGQDICAEMLVSGWMQPFVAPVVQALDLLEAGRAPGRGHGCARVPFAVYAAAGWPMLAGKIDHLTFETRAIRFDYRPAPDELDLPGRGFMTVIREAIWPAD